MGCLYYRVFFYVIIVIWGLLQSNVNMTAIYPPDFMWGTATASYQIEGAYNEDGRGPSIWDTFSHEGKCRNNDTGDVADDHYHRLEEDIKLMTDLNIKWYRLSLSWSRILPTGRAPINQAGINHYKRELQLLIDAGITPFVTLYHWDLPQGLENDGGWRNRSIVTDFKYYSDICFQNFKNVKHWITFNEPYCIAWLGHGVGVQAPGRCSDRRVCREGDSATEPYLVAHHLLLAHGETVNLYREKYKPEQQGKIGITLNSDWAEPLSTYDTGAAERYMQFLLGWFAHPVFIGDYPDIMKSVSNLPVFSQSEIDLIKGTSDFFGLNHYTSLYATDATKPAIPGWATDNRVFTTYFNKNNVSIGQQAESTWLYVVPWGFRKLLSWIKVNYNDPIVIVTENGVSVPNESSLPLPEVLHDNFRANYYSQYLNELGKSISEDHVNIKGYFAWSLLDNFEWADGYAVRFGLHYVDYKHNLTRYVKDSARFYSKYVADTTLIDSKLWYIAFYILPAVSLLIIVLVCLLYEKTKKSTTYTAVI